MGADGGAATVTGDLMVLEGVAKDYDTGGGLVRALRDIDLNIAHGEFVAIVGTSGSGKSTLMNILGCLDRPTRGRYLLAGVEVGARPNDARAIVRNRLVGFIFQGFNLLPRTTALENVELPLQYRGVSARERRKRAEAALAAVGLQDRIDHTPNMLSGGQQQRVAIARALVTDPPLLLADEPTGNLDTRTSLEVLALLQRLNRDRGITIALVTHEHDIAACASRVITFRDGRMVSDVRQASPLDAAAALAALPPPQHFDAAKPDDGRVAVSPSRTRIPPAAYFTMLAGTLVGGLIGYMYGALIVGQPVPGAGAVAGFACEAAFSQAYARRKLGRALSWDERARLAIYYSLALLLAISAGLALAGSGATPRPLREAIEGRPLLGVALAFGLLAASSCARMLTLWLFARGRIPSKAH